MSNRRLDVAREMAGRAHADVDPNPKGLARRMGVSDRSAQRYRKPADAKGSPMHRMELFAANSPHPERIVAAMRTHLYRSVARLSTPELIAQIHAKYAEDSQVEGEENAARFRRGMSALDRAALHERDASVDEWLAAAWRECAVRRISEADVFGDVDA